MGQDGYLYTHLYTVHLYTWGMMVICTHISTQCTCTHGATWLSVHTSLHSASVHMGQEGYLYPHLYTAHLYTWGKRVICTHISTQCICTHGGNMIICTHISTQCICTHGARWLSVHISLHSASVHMGQDGYLYTHLYTVYLYTWGKMVICTHISTQCNCTHGARWLSVHTSLHNASVHTGARWLSIHTSLHSIRMKLATEHMTVNMSMPGDDVVVGGGGGKERQRERHTHMKKCWLIVIPVFASFHPELAPASSCLQLAERGKEKKKGTSLCLFPCKMT